MSWAIDSAGDPLPGHPQDWPSQVQAVARLAVAAAVTLLAAAVLMSVGASTGAAAAEEPGLEEKLDNESWKEEQRMEIRQMHRSMDEAEGPDKYLLNDSDELRHLVFEYQLQARHGWYSPRECESVGLDVWTAAAVTWAHGRVGDDDVLNATRDIGSTLDLYGTDHYNSGGGSA